MPLVQVQIVVQPYGHLRGTRAPPSAAEMQEGGLRYIPFVGVLLQWPRAPPEFAVAIRFVMHAARHLGAHHHHGLLLRRARV